MPGADLALLLDAARAAGEIAQAHLSRGVRSWDKPDGAGPVTDADLAVDRYLRETLCAARPDYGWLSEESAPDPARLTAQTVFIVDPIDGTRSFVDGQDTWAHSLAIVRDGVVTEAVVYLPARDKLYHARTGQGAWFGGAAGGSERLRASTRAGLTGATVLAARPALQADHWPGGVPDIHRTYRPSLAYRLALVAEGRMDAMLTLRPTWEWDIAAGALLCSEAGAVISDRTGARLRFNAPDPRLNGVVAAGAAVYPPLIRGLSSPSM